MHQILFFLSLASALFGWSILLAVPKSKIASWIIETKLLHGLICIFYGIAVVTAEGVPDSAGFFSVSGVLSLFESRDAVVAAWLHIVVFDFFVGTWILEDSLLTGVGRLTVSLVLFLTIMLGPLGLLVYLLVRWGKKTCSSA